MERGNAAVIAVSLTTLVGFAALSVDTALISLADAQLQVATDAAALAGAAALDGTTEGVADARAAVTALAAEHTVLGATVTLDATAVTLGTFRDGVFASSTEPETINAVRVQAPATAVDTILAGVAFGVRTVPVVAAAMAQRPWSSGPAGASECFLPLAIPDCHLQGLAEGENPPAFEFTFSPSPSDNIAWGNPRANPNSNWIRDQLRGQCEGGQIEVGDVIHVNEGQHNSALHTTRDILNDMDSVAPEAWPGLLGPVPTRDGVHANAPADSEVWPSEFGQVIQGPVALVDAGASCASPSFSGSLTITGIAWGVMYDVNSKGRGKDIWVQLDVVNEYDTWGEAVEESTADNVLGVGPARLMALP